MRYAIVLSYDGTPFCGWQSQPNGSSIQDAVEAAVKSLTGETVRMTGSGRTDAGVHALGQVAHFDLIKDMPDASIVGGLNAYLPRTVRVLRARHVGDNFDARKSAKRKTYMYLFYTGAAHPVLANRALFTGELDVDAMNAAAANVVGTHDFKSFMAAGSGAKTSVRTVYDAHVERDGRFVKFFITADGFLYNMVRIIASLIVGAGCGESEDILALIAARDRTLAKRTAPAHGLYLYGVEYPDAERL